ncbi:MAG TPA: hypothetical protein EYN96_05450 [Candidatus Hydrogenedentes bacterium]|jgi:hypothetical protein|nr:hypothetical protein [Candidatus Hydrogenedentota bacterium]
MRSAGSPDVFIVLNGPQDGTEFPVGASAIQIGQEGSCTVNLLLDQDVQPIHATATAMGKGYTIRATTNSPVIVEGKKATRFKSRVLGSGEIMRVGYTDLMLECSPDGMSSRSQGIALQNDFGWAAKNLVKIAFRILEQLGRLMLLLPKFAMRHWFITIILIVILAGYVPVIGNIFDQIVDRVKSIIADALRK